MFNRLKKIFKTLRLRWELSKAREALLTVKAAEAGDPWSLIITFRLPLAELKRAAEQEIARLEKLLKK